MTQILLIVYPYAITYLRSERINYFNIIVGIKQKIVIIIFLRRHIIMHLINKKIKKEFS